MKIKSKIRNLKRNNLKLLLHQLKLNPSKNKKLYQWLRHKMKILIFHLEKDSLKPNNKKETAKAPKKILAIRNLQAKIMRNKEELGKEEKLIRMILKIWISVKTKIVKQGNNLPDLANINKKQMEKLRDF